MSKGPKTTTTSTNTGTQAGSTANTFDQIVPLNTPDTDALRGFTYEPDPSSPYRYAQAGHELEQQRDDVYGGYTTPAIREAKRHNDTMTLRQQQGQESTQENFNRNSLEGARLATLAELTKPQVVQTGGTYSGTSSGSGTGTSQQSGGLGQFILGNAIEGAAAGATAGGG